MDSSFMTDPFVVSRRPAAPNERKLAMDAPGRRRYEMLLLSFVSGRDENGAEFHDKERKGDQPACPA